MNILVTGSIGFIGSNFCNWLLDNTDYGIIALDNGSTGFSESIPESRGLRPQRVHCDVATEPEWLNQVFDKFKPSICYHFAAYASEGRSNYIRSFIHQNNTVGTANVINACVNHGCKLVFTSSVAVYSGQPPFNEQTIPNPIDEYALSKWMSEKSIQIAGEQQGLDWCIIRPRNVYGENQNLFDKSRNVMGIWMYQILNNQPMTIYGDGSNVRSFTYIQDILKPLYRAKDVSKEIINLGSAGAWSIRDANKILQDVTGYTNVVHTEPRHEVKEAFCEVAKSRILLGFETETSLRVGLTNMWSWAKTVEMRDRMIPPPLEIKSTNHSSIV